MELLKRDLKKFVSNEFHLNNLTVETMFKIRGHILTTDNIDNIVECYLTWKNEFLCKTLDLEHVSPQLYYELLGFEPETALKLVQKLDTECGSLKEHNNLYFREILIYLHNQMMKNRDKLEKIRMTFQDYEYF